MADIPHLTSQNPSQFNAAYDNLIKLFGWLYETDRYYDFGNYYRMKRILDNVWRIMDMFIRERDKEWQVKFYALREKLNGLVKVYTYMEAQVQDYKKVNDRIVFNNINNSLGEGCEQYELMLRDLIHFKNMDLPEKEDITMAVLED